MDDDCTVDLDVDDIGEVDKEVLEFEGFVNDITILPWVSGGVSVGAGGSEWMSCMSSPVMDVWVLPENIKL